MSVRAITQDYHGEIKDAQENYHGQVMVFIGWDHHLLFCSAKAFALSPDMLFSEVIEKVMPEAFGQHPEFGAVQWQNAQWFLNREVFQPDFSRSLADQGITHKSMIRFHTPDLKGYAQAGI